MSCGDELIFESLPEALVVTALAERLDYMIVDTLQRRISAQATMAGKFNIILDFGQVGHIPSVIMSVLVNTLRGLQEEGRKLVLVGMNRHMRAAFKLTRMDTLFDVFDTCEDALEALCQPECD